MARVWTHCHITGKELTEEQIKRRERMDRILINSGVKLEDGPVKPGMLRIEPMTDEERIKIERLNQSLDKLLSIADNVIKNKIDKTK